MRTTSTAAAALAVAGLASAKTFDAISKTNVATYWGQGDDQDSLLSYCGNPNIDIVNIGFVNVFPDQGKAGWPGTNFGNQCGNETYTYKNTSTQLLSNCPNIGPDITLCQQLYGTKILLSIGGASANGYNMDDTSATNFANFLWGSFGPLVDAWIAMDGPRPFGDAVVDGFDFDIESELSQAPTVDGSTITDYKTRGWAAMVNKFKNSLFPTDTSKQYYLSAAPQCVVPDEHLATVIANSWFDFLFVQFYNTAQCSARAAVSSSSFTGYTNWMSAPSYNPAVKIYMGLAAAEKSAADDSFYLEPSEVNTLVGETYPETKFGGIMLWQATTAEENVICGKDYATWMKQILKAKAAGKSIDTETSPCPAQPITVDGSCGPYTGYTCAGSTWGSCCSVYGYCGNQEEYCTAATCDPSSGDCGDEYVVGASSSNSTSNATASASESMTIASSTASLSSSSMSTASLSTSSLSSSSLSSSSLSTASLSSSSLSTASLNASSVSASSSSPSSLSTASLNASSLSPSSLSPSSLSPSSLSPSSLSTASLNASALSTSSSSSSPLGTARIVTASISGAISAVVAPIFPLTTASATGKYSNSSSAIAESAAASEVSAQGSSLVILSQSSTSVSSSLSSLATASPVDESSPVGDAEADQQSTLMTTSTVVDYITQTITTTNAAGEPTVYVTAVLTSYTTICPVTAAEATAISSIASATKSAAVSNYNAAPVNNNRGSTYLTTSTVLDTITQTITTTNAAGEPTVYATEILTSYTTVCPVTAAEATASANMASATPQAATSTYTTPQAGASTHISAPASVEFVPSTKTIYSTEYVTMTSCAPSVANCPAQPEKQTTVTLTSTYAVGTTLVYVAPKSGEKTSTSTSTTTVQSTVNVYKTVTLSSITASAATSTPESSAQLPVSSSVASVAAPSMASSSIASVAAPSMASSSIASVAAPSMASSSVASVAAPSMVSSSIASVAAQSMASSSVSVAAPSMASSSVFVATSSAAPSSAAVEAFLASSSSMEMAQSSSVAALEVDSGGRYAYANSSSIAYPTAGTASSTIVQIITATVAPIQAQVSQGFNVAAVSGVASSTLAYNMTASTTMPAASMFTGAASRAEYGMGAIALAMGALFAL